MAVIGVLPGDRPPPAWAVLVVGGAMIGNSIYLGRTWGDGDRTIRDALIAALFFVVGGALMVYGATLLSAA